MPKDRKVLGHRESRVVCGLAGRDAGCFRGGPQTGVLCPQHKGRIMSAILLKNFPKFN